MPMQKLADLIISPATLADIYTDIDLAVKTLLDGFYKDIPETDDRHLRIKHELLFINRKRNLPIPCYVHRKFRPTNIRNSLVEHLHTPNSEETRQLVIIAECLEYGSRVWRHKDPAQIPQVLSVLDWFAQLYWQAAEVNRDTGSEEEDAALLADITTMRELIAKGSEINVKNYAGYQAAYKNRLRATPAEGGSYYLTEAYKLLQNLLEENFIPLMPEDIGGRYIFIQSSLGKFHPLFPPDHLRVLEFPS